MQEGNRRNFQIEGSRRGGVKIEELPDDHDIVDAGQSNSIGEPIVEHPEDDDKTGIFYELCHRTYRTRLFGGSSFVYMAIIHRKLCRPRSLSHALMY